MSDDSLPWPSWKFNEEDAEILENINIIMSIFSFMGSLFIIFCYNKFPELRSFAFKLVLFVSVADFGTAVGNFLGDAGGNQDTHLSAGVGLCKFQAILLSYFNLASMLWSVSIAFTLHMAFLKGNKEYHSPLIEMKINNYHLVCWGFPAIMTLLPLTTSSYGDTGGWCWINANDKWSKAWAMLQFYIPLWMSICYNSWVYYHVYHKMSDMLSGQMGRDMYRIRLYPLVLVICWFWGTINTLQSAISGELGPLWLNGLHIFFASAMGFINACVYGMTPAVKSEVSNMLGCEDVPRGTSLSNAESTMYEEPYSEGGI